VEEIVKENIMRLRGRSKTRSWKMLNCEADEQVREVTDELEEAAAPRINVPRNFSHVSRDVGSVIDSKE
jgi:hypothetical protein